MRIYPFSGTATNADVLSGTDLNQLEEGGILDIYALSTATDTALSIRAPQVEPLVTAGRVPQETRAIAPGRDGSYRAVLKAGGHVTVALTIVTAGTWQILAIYREAGEIE